ncbi:MAG: MFS transporter [Ruminococcaceae bacterium]|nr:MFS transporter [Oscillospiraceae bacterium]
MKRTLTVCCAGHFLVDLGCAFLLFRAFPGHWDWAGLLILYNFCAFAMQMPLGLLADGWKRDGAVAAAGAILVAAAYALTDWPVLAVWTAGLGNAAFHIGAGLETLTLSGERAGPLGLFVSPGAVGLFVGTLLGRGMELPFLILPPVLLAVAAALLLFRAERDELHTKPELPKWKAVGVPLAALLAVVVLRSFVGMNLTFPWKGEGRWVLLLTFAVAAGKAAGGYLADRFGMRRIALASLLLCAGSMLLSGSPVFGTMAVLLFNMTMPLTLWAAARLLPGARGFAFGILTFGLFLGFLPSAFGAPALTGRAAAILSLTSLALLLPGLRKAVRQ